MWRWVQEPLATRMVDPPTISMTFGANDSPLAGKEGKFVTGNHVKARLHKELENNVSILVKPSPDPDSVEVGARQAPPATVRPDRRLTDGRAGCVWATGVLARMMLQVHGRGELQLGILVEQMRREGYELCVSPPKASQQPCPPACLPAHLCRPNAQGA